MDDSVEGGLYRLIDDIRNFKIRVRLKKSGLTRDEPGNGVECLDIKWGEKHFSQLEEEFYSNELNCFSLIERNYHKLVMDMKRRGGRPNRRLYTVIRNVPSSLDRRKMKKKRLQGEREETMIIMVDMSPTDRASTDAGLRDECVLCQLVVNNSKSTLTVTPDLMDVWRKVESRRNDMYEFHLENVSIAMDPMGQRKVDKLTIQALKLTASKFDLGTWQDHSPKHQMIVLGSIVLARGFPGSTQLYTQTTLSTNTDGAPVVSQISECRDNVAHFACPLEYVLTSESGTSWPHIVLEVCSLDTWDRHSVVGYGTMGLPSTPGFQRFTVNTWKPTSRSIAETMRHYFIGGGPELRDSSYLNVKNGVQARYGLETDSSGSVELNLCTVFQKPVA